MESISQVLGSGLGSARAGQRESRAVGWRIGGFKTGFHRNAKWSKKNFIMSGFFIAVLAVGVILGFMILIHEFGHYAVAKLLGVRVEVFSIGFGKRLLGFRRGDTDYRITAIPLGGYVKMSGENPMDERTGDPGEFMSHPRWHRFLIAIAGPAMNILFAVGLLTCVYMVRYEYPAVLDEPAVIGWVVPDTPAAKAGIQVGDRIVRIDGIENPTWEQVIPREALNPNQPLEVTIERGGQTLTKTIVPEAYGPNQMGSAGWAPKEPSFPITDLEPGMPAEKAGMKLGDEILSVDGQPIAGLEAMIESLKRTKDKPIQITVRRERPAAQFHGAAGVVRHQGRQALSRRHRPARR